MPCVEWIHIVEHIRSGHLREIDSLESSETASVIHGTDSPLMFEDGVDAPCISIAVEDASPCCSQW